MKKTPLYIALVAVLLSCIIADQFLWPGPNQPSTQIIMGSGNPLIEHILDENATVDTIRNAIVDNPEYVNLPGNLGYYPIHQCLFLDYDVAKQIISFLVSEGADINQRAVPYAFFGNAPTFEVTPLHITANRTNIDTRITALLLELGADSTLKDQHGLTPLDTANKSNNDGVVHLIEKFKKQDVEEKPKE